MKLFVNVSSELVLFDDILSLGLSDSCGDVERSQHVKLVALYFRDSMMNLRSCKQRIEDSFLYVESSRGCV